MREGEEGREGGGVKLCVCVWRGEDRRGKEKGSTGGRDWMILATYVELDSQHQQP